MEADTGNADQITYWNEASGPKWVSAQPLFDAMISPIGALALAQAAVQRGERVLDVGCGCGQTTLELAARVGPEGRVVGLDVSRPMLARARERAAKEGLTHVEFCEADAQVALLESSFDVVFSRFGVMFFADPVAAFTNLRKAVVPAGRLAFVCWRALQDNPWMYVPLRALAAHIELPPAPDPLLPGPFAFADPDRVRSILERAGWTDVQLDAHPVELAITPGAGLDGAVAFLLDIGPASRVLQDVDPSVRAQAPGWIREALRPYLTPKGVVMEGNVWVVSAQSPRA